jgi:hypothetical protein
MRTSCSTIAVLALLVGALVTGGCSSDSPTSPTANFTQQDADDAAVQATIALANLGSVIEGAAGADGGASPGSPLALTSRQPGLGVQSDTTWSHGSLVFELSRRWFSLTGTEQDLPDATTDSVHVTSRIAGTDSTDRYVVTIGHAGSSSLGGLNPLRDEVWLNVAQSDTLVSRFAALYRPVTRHFEGRTITTASDVRWLKPTSPEPTYPGSGTLVMTLAAIAYRDGARLDVEKSWNATIVITFNGTRYPDVVINGSWQYVWDMESGTIVRAGSV